MHLLVASGMLAVLCLPALLAEHVYVAHGSAVTADQPCQSDLPADGDAGDRSCDICVAFATAHGFVPATQATIVAAPWRGEVAVESADVVAVEVPRSAWPRGPPQV